MIRYAKGGDRADIVRIWKSCFCHDSDTYISRFLDLLGQPEHCLIVEQDGLPVSMLFLLPCDIQVQGRFEPSCYIYACATLPTHRGKGHMSDLLRFAFDEAVRQNYFALLLIPDGNELITFYEKSGFQCFFRQFKFHSTQLKESEIPYTRYEMLPDKRRKLLTEEYSVHWPENHLLFALHDFCENGGKLLKTEQGYMACIEKDEVIEFKEIMPLSEKNCNKTEECYGMIRFCKIGVETGQHRPYLNWGLD